MHVLATAFLLLWILFMLSIIVGMIKRIVATFIQLAPSRRAWSAQPLPTEARYPPAAPRPVVWLSYTCPNHLGDSVRFHRRSDDHEIACPVCGGETILERRLT